MRWLVAGALLAAIVVGSLLPSPSAFAMDRTISTPSCTGNCTFGVVDAGSIYASNISVSAIDAGVIALAGKLCLTPPSCAVVVEQSGGNSIGMTASGGLTTSGQINDMGLLQVGSALADSLEVRGAGAGVGPEIRSASNQTSSPINIAPKGTAPVLVTQNWLAVLDGGFATKNEVVADGGIRIGPGGTLLLKATYVSATINFPNLVAGACDQESIYAPDAVASDAVIPAWPASLQDVSVTGVMYVANGGGSVTVELCGTGASQDPASDTYGAIVLHH